ncbi:hypothetical protein [Cerasicoccus arenae]|uniref:Uncharacterized protein n=1 Tax=Cerasicoccus arenae TaxID=424488 RepID=A0A8J3GBS7_9BACT|nr:hypothetical protein [Cerasicoccus arenae]MBK1859685.1 hypothetical protein [Cerasicoccus arenae]GHB93032.1 hypothetical protein GCM10007047_05540 [Cerasicoccus arenae]
MGKLSANENTNLRKLRSTPGMRSMVELREDGVIVARRGAPNEDLAAATTDFLRIGKMLGLSLGLEDMQEMHVLQAKEAITFAESSERRIGLIHHDDLERLLDLNHGT